VSAERDRTRQTYDAVAAELLARTRDRTGMRDALDRFASHVGRGALVLDIGAGPGADSGELRARGLRVVSLDLSLGMLATGARVLPGPRVQADMGALPFRDVADGLWLSASLLHVPRERAPLVLRELRRVLKPAGIAYVSVKCGTADGWEIERYGPGHPRWFTFWQPGPFDAALADAGFECIEAQTRQGSHDVWLERLLRVG
jgi:ubiquinone/menaquinone biosynthesis C-methylase UbiE